MKVLFVSSDPKLFDAGSVVRRRMQEYAALFGELHIISRVSQKGAVDAREQNLFLYPASGFLSLFWRARQIVLKRDIDVVSAQDPFEHGLVAYAARAGTRAKLHVQLHTDMFAPYFRWHSFWNIARLPIARFVFSRAHRIRVVYSRLKDALQIAGYKPSVISVLPIFTDVERFKNLQRLKHPRFKIALLIASRLEREKNIASAIRALKYVRDAGHDAGLTIVGDGRERAILTELARSLRLERFVEFMGHRGDISPYLSTADAVLVPSYYEGYGLTLVEALAAGVPVIATDVGVAREAGAMVVSEEEFPQALAKWCTCGPRRGELQNYPYKDKEDYLSRFKEDIASTLR